MHTELQTDINGAIIDKILEENKILKAELRRKTMNIDLIREDDENTKFYTGLPTWKVCEHLYHFLVPHVNPSLSLSLEEYVFVLDFFIKICRLVS